MKLSYSQHADFMDGLNALKQARSRAEGNLNSIVWVMLLAHKSGLAPSEADWTRLQDAYDAVEAADQAVTDYCIKTEVR